MLTPTVRAFYTVHDHFTDSGSYASLLAMLPTDPTELLATINNVVMHVWKVRKHHPEWLGERPHDVYTRRIASILARIHSLDSSALTEPRPEENRAIVDCRSFALLLCAILRERGIPARARCGFATYLEETHYQDHWVCEHWSDAEGRWLRTDPDLQKQDVSPAEFYTGNEAWQYCRDTPDNAKKFGYGPGVTGLWAVRYELIRDFAALNGFISVSGDSWKLAHTKPSPVMNTEFELLDSLAATMLSDDTFAERQRLYEATETIHPPDTLRHYDYLVARKAQYVSWHDQD